MSGIAPALPDLDPSRPVLIAGATASGKSALAMRIADRDGGRIVNADALQVFDGWRVLTARPSTEDEARVPHALYGHVPIAAPYSVGDWLRAVRPLLTEGPRPIIVGGTGLYFRALTEGLADIPATPEDIRAEATARREAHGLDALIGDLDAQTRNGIDLANPMRVQRAWEVQRATGRGLAAWQSDTPPPLLPLSAAQPLWLDAGREWVNARIERRFDAMLRAGALDEAHAIAPKFDPGWASSKAIGAAELVAVARGEMRMRAAREAAITASRQYAKRQRTWFRARMGGWRRVPLP